MTDVYTSSKVQEYMEDAGVDVDITVSHDTDDPEPFRLRYEGSDRWLSDSDLRTLTRAINKALSIQPKSLKA